MKQIAPLKLALSICLVLGIMFNSNAQDSFAQTYLKDDGSGYKLRITKSYSSDKIIKAEWWYPEYKTWKTASKIDEASWEKFTLTSAVSGKKYVYTIDDANQMNLMETAPNGKTVVYREPYVFHLWATDDGSGYKIRMTTTPDQGVPPISAEWYDPNKKKWMAFEVESYDVIDVVYKLKSPVTGKVYTYYSNTRTGFKEGYRGGGEDEEYGLVEESPDGSKRFYPSVSTSDEKY